MAIEKVKAYFASLGLENRILEFDVSSATVLLAATALGCAPERIAKSLAFADEGRSLLVVTAGDGRIDNKKFKAAFHRRGKMLDGENVARLIGHEIGGVCPFAVNDGVEVYLDQSLQRFTTVFPACGSPNSAIELTIPELEMYSRSLGWVDICKDWK